MGSACSFGLLAQQAFENAKAFGEAGGELLNHVV